MTAPVPKCARNGCPLPRGWRTAGDGRRRPREHCSHACLVWEARARRAVASGDASEARELMALATKLDARTHPGQVIPRLLRDPRKAG